MPGCPGLDASGGPPIYMAVALTCASDTAQAIRRFFQVMPYLSFSHEPGFLKPLNFVVFFPKLKQISVILGIILDFLGKSCCSEKIITDFQSNIPFGQLGFQPSKQGRQEFPGLILQSLIDKTYY